MYFDELDLNDYVLDALDDMQFETCTPIQESCIPHILAGRDILGVAQTGTGKTAAYLLPILSKLADGGYPADAINCVIMSPTRELAQQIDQAMQGFAYHLDGVSSVAVYGGNDGNRYDQELKSLSLGADVVIATPGRFISHMSLGNVDLSRVSFFILDEADRMLDMGFSEDILTIARKLPQNVQTIMFSATMPDKIEDLAKTLLKNPVEVKLAVSKPAEKIQQKAYVCYETQKMAILKDIFKAGDLNRVIMQGREEGASRMTILKRLCAIRGVYVPALYDVQYNADGTIASMKPNCPEAPEKVLKAIIPDLDKAFYPTEIPVPYMEIIHDRIMLEIMRGCTRGCRFCQAGILYRPVRERSLEHLVELAQQLENTTGYEEISLSSLSSGDYTCLAELIRELIRRLDEKHVSISLPSLRLDSVLKDSLEATQKEKKTSLTFAPEAGTQRLRDAINKNVTEEEILPLIDKTVMFISKMEDLLTFK